VSEANFVLRLPIGADRDRVREVFRGDPGVWLPRPARPHGPGRWGITVRAGPIARTVECRVGDVWEVDYVLWRRLVWTPEEEAGDVLPIRDALPVLDGALGLEDHGGTPVVVLDGRYRPLAGAAGVVLDRAALRLVATATARRFLEEVIDRLAATAPAPPARGGRRGRQPLRPGATPAAS
jgi:hypothetical protein